MAPPGGSGRPCVAVPAAVPGTVEPGHQLESLPAVGVENVAGALLDSLPYVPAFLGLLVFAARARKPAAIAAAFSRGVA